MAFLNKLSPGPSHELNCLTDFIQTLRLQMDTLNEKLLLVKFTFINNSHHLANQHDHSRNFSIYQTIESEVSLFIAEIHSLLNKFYRAMLIEKGHSFLGNNIEMGTRQMTMQTHNASAHSESEVVQEDQRLNEFEQNNNPHLPGDGLDIKIEPESDASIQNDDVVLSNSPMMIRHNSNDSLDHSGNFAYGSRTASALSNNMLSKPKVKLEDNEDLSIIYEVESPALPPPRTSILAQMLQQPPRVLAHLQNVEGHSSASSPKMDDLMIVRHPLSTDSQSPSSHSTSSTFSKSSSIEPMPFSSSHYIDKLSTLTETLDQRPNDLQEKDHMAMGTFDQLVRTRASTKRKLTTPGINEPSLLTPKTEKFFPP